MLVIYVCMRTMGASVVMCVRVRLHVCVNGTL